MDENKKKAMLAAGVRVAESCYTCKHAIIAASGNICSEGDKLVGWGYCMRLRYKHKKHSQPVSYAPAHAAFCCSKWELRPSVERELGVYFDIFSGEKP